MDMAIITKLAMSEEENIALHFNMNLETFTKSLEIGDGIYVLTNTSTQSKLSVLSRLVRLYDEDLADLVFYLRDENEANSDELSSRYEFRRKYWTYALPILQKAHCIKDNVLLDETCRSVSFSMNAYNKIERGELYDTP